MKNLDAPWRRLLRQPTRELLFRTARFDGIEARWWNFLNHHILGGPRS